MPTDSTRDAASPDYGSLSDRQDDGSDATERERSDIEFQRRDQDGDGGLTAEEYVGAAQGGQVSRRLRDFMMADADGDGQLTLAEWHRLRGTTHAGDQLLDLGDLLRKAAPEAGDALRKVLGELPIDALGQVAERLDMTEAAGSVDAEKRMAAIVRAVSAALGPELESRPEAKARIDGWLAKA